MQTASQLHSIFYCSNKRSYLKPNGWMKTKSMNFSQLGFSRHCQMYKFTSPVQQTKLFVMPNMDDGHLSVPMSILEEDTNTNHAPSSGGEKVLEQMQLERVGPRSVGVCLLTSAFVGMAFTIQFVREFTRLGLNRSIGGVLALAFSRELSPVVTSIVVAGRIGSAFAAELGTMQVSEQIDTLRVLGADPVDYLVIPRVIASCLALPFLTLMCFTVGMASSGLLADSVYGISLNIILDSAQRALNSWDLISAMIKSGVFGAIISIVSCAWGVTTMGGAKGVGESTTSAVVISLVGIFIADFVLSYCFFQGAGDSLKNCV
ncbi:hypothetical protein OIU78_011120 [Salix suchowensis]|nr:hypothetical protein OIU78_011120 [Salix suchowensis]